MTGVLVLDDQFAYSTWAEAEAAGWKIRNPAYAAEGERSLIKGDPRAVGFDNGKLRLKIVPDPDAPGKHLVGHITTGKLPNLVYGRLEARIRFARPKGAHGGFWHQGGYGPGQAELDGVESFGERKPGTSELESQPVYHTIWTGDGAGGLVKAMRSTWTDGKPAGVGPAFGGLGRFGGNGTWWNYYHTYGCDWTPAGYNFDVDGVDVGSIALTGPKPAADQPGEIILSNLISDGAERVAFDAYDGPLSDFEVSVDRVRAWTL